MDLNHEPPAYKAGAPTIELLSDFVTIPCPLPYALRLSWPFLRPSVPSPA